ncbi:hypothetical protein J2W46_003093 [Paraburkholderia strydomiana]|nr:hypothetical protein [Paraburkholderia strydomiana]
MPIDAYVGRQPTSVDAIPMTHQQRFAANAVAQLPADQRTILSGARSCGLASYGGLVLPVGHRLVSTRAISLERLADEPLIFVCRSGARGM